jgi:hypothetical protein
MAHEEFDEAVASYALDALDPAEARAFETHLATCARCQSELAELRRVVAGIGLTTEPVAPPEALKARAIRRATASDFVVRTTDTIERVSFPPVPPAPRASAMPWLLAAAAILVAVASGMYAWSLRARVSSLEQMVAVTSAQADRLRNELISLRTDSSRLIQTVQIVTAPDARQVVLKGQAGAESATGRAYWSPSRGLVFNADQLPALSAGRVYQLWVIAGQKPVGVGTFEVANGSVSRTFQLPPGVGPIEAVAVTNEPAPNGSATPTLPILLIGQ